MVKCAYCGQENPDDNKFCTHCGAPMEKEPPVEQPQEDQFEQYEPVTVENQPPDESPVDQYNDHTGFDSQAEQFNQPVQPVQPMPLGGLIAWAVFVILGCWIPGAVALYFIFKINKAQSVEEQQQYYQNARRTLIIGTALSVLNLLAQFGSR